MEFCCERCGKSVERIKYGGRYRNHCPFCLWSKHVDVQKGDRRSPCGGMMEPVEKFVRRTGEDVIVHTCKKCGVVRWNRVAGDDSETLVAKLPKMSNIKAQNPKKSSKLKENVS